MIGDRICIRIERELGDKRFHLDHHESLDLIEGLTMNREQWFAFVLTDMLKEMDAETAKWQERKRTLE